MPAAAKMKSRGKVMVIQRLSGCVLFCISFITGYCEARSQLCFRFYSLFRFRATSRTSFIHPALLTLDILGSSKVWPLILDAGPRSMIYAKKERWWCVTITSTVAVFFTSYGARVKLLAFIFGISYEYHYILSYEALHYASVSECFGRFLVTLGSFGLQSSDLRLQMRKEWPKSGQRVAKEWPQSGQRVAKEWPLGRRSQKPWAKAGTAKERRWRLWRQSSQPNALEGHRSLSFAYCIWGHSIGHGTITNLSAHLALHQAHYLQNCQLIQFRSSAQGDSLSLACPVSNSNDITWHAFWCCTLTDTSDTAFQQWAWAIQTATPQCIF